MKSSYGRARRVVSVGAGVSGPILTSHQAVCSHIQCADLQEKDTHTPYSHAVHTRRTHTPSSSLNYPFTRLRYCLYNPFIGWIRDEFERIELIREEIERHIHTPYTHAVFTRCIHTPYTHANPIIGQIREEFERIERIWEETECRIHVPYTHAVHTRRPVVSTTCSPG